MGTHRDSIGTILEQTFEREDGDFIEALGRLSLWELLLQAADEPEDSAWE